MEESTGTLRSMRTERLLLESPAPGDLDVLFAICSDPQVWTHYPSLRHLRPAQTAAAMQRWSEGWDVNGLDVWVVRGRNGAVLGYGGCSLKHGVYWNLGYRLSVQAQGQGYATEVARTAIDRARAVRPDAPVVALLVEHNWASDAVARKVGLGLEYRGPDVGNPDPDVVRLVYSDRPLSDVQIRSVLG